VTHGQGRAGFVLANGGRSGHSCSVKIVEDIRQHAAEQGLTTDEALKNGRKANSLECMEQGAMVCTEAYDD